MQSESTVKPQSAVEPHYAVRFYCIKLDETFCNTPPTMTGLLEKYYLLLSMYFWYEFEFHF